MARVESIKLEGARDKWMKLMFHLQRSVAGVFQLSFSSASEAKHAHKSLSAVVSRHPTWYPMVILQRDSCVYVIKTQYLKKVMIQ